MVRQSIKDIDIEKLRMAKDVLSVLEVMGISEQDIDEVLSLREEVKALKAEVALLREFKDSQIATQKNENNKSISDMIAESFNGKVEEFKPYGKQ